MSLHSAARTMGDEPELEWTFSLLLFRALALMPESGGQLTGTDLHYEPLNNWEETTEVFRVNAALRAAEPNHADIMEAGVTVGLELFDGAYRAPGGRLRLPAPNEPFRGRHSVTAVALTADDRGAIDCELVFRNSWGERWGDAGYGYINREYFESHVDSVWLTRPSWLGPSPAMERAMKERSWQHGRGGAIESSDLLGTWRTINEVLVSDTLVRGHEYTLHRRVSFSARTSNPRLEVIDIRARDGQICGRCHLAAIGNLASIEELFVRPEARRQGIGSELLRRGMMRARALRSSGVELLLHEADAGRGRARAIAFGESLGAVWQPCDRRRPNIVSVGSMSL